MDVHKLYSTIKFVIGIGELDIEFVLTFDICMPKSGMQPVGLYFMA